MYSNCTYLYHFQVAIEMDGDYKLCFDNKKSRSGSKLIFFELLLDNDGEGDMDYDDLAPDDDYGDEVEEMGASLKVIKERITKSRHLQEQIRAHEFKDRSIAERNFERINFWSLVQMIVMIVAGLSQVLMIRSIFDEKSPIRKIFKWNCIHITYLQLVDNELFNLAAGNIWSWRINKK